MTSRRMAVRSAAIGACAGAAQLAVPNSCKRFPPRSEHLHQSAPAPRLAGETRQSGIM
eukprot:CAMPEP_0175553004 /NCGR_PEP_ID=MMETSP0096-20121207/33126_1 /TAXON_ID=311494 /ORGANISM="Alexandrium monilatum, Strain CCMP3105" /LENGTH=57 /DNA_ID=CAMNT_0016856089 /DNA_START=208 /DNA_END=378 /DNA_ORIENTATION=-